MIELNHQITIDKTRDEVWAFFTNISYWGRWSRVIRHAAIYGPLQAGTLLKCIAGKWDFSGEINTVESNSHLSFEAKCSGIRITMLWSFSDSESGAEIAVKSSIYGWLTKLFSARIRDGFDDSIRIWLNSLKLAIEQGRLLPEEEKDDDSDDTDRRTVQFTDSLSLLINRKKPS